MAKGNANRNVVVIIVSVAVIGFSALATFYLTDGMRSKTSSGQSYQHVTFTDAILSCESEARGQFGSGLIQLNLDKHSSRFEHNVSTYKIFLKADIRGKKNITTQFFISCYVESRKGKVTTFEAFENKEAPRGEAIKRNSDKFIEWP